MMIKKKACQHVMPTWKKILAEKVHGHFQICMEKAQNFQLGLTKASIVLKNITNVSFKS